MVYTERMHFYHRHTIRGIRHIIFYAPPAHADFYAEMLNMLAAAAGEKDGLSPPSVTVLFTKYDALCLERIVGSTRYKRMVKGKSGKSTYLFM